MRRKTKWKTTKTSAICLLAASCTGAILSGCAAKEKQAETSPVGQEITADDVISPTADESITNEPSSGKSITSVSTTDDLTINEPTPDESTAAVSQTLYEQFLNNEISTIVRLNSSESEYMRPIFEENRSYTLTEFGTCVSQYFLDLDTDKSSYDYMQYAYVDCPDSADSNDKNLLLKFVGLNIYSQDDDSYAVFVITEENDQLYVTGSYQCWARSATTAYANGTLRSFGSGGAGDHYDGLSVLLADGRLEAIYDAEILSGWWTSYISDTIYNEIFDENAEINLIVSIYTIGEEKYCQYDMSECSEEERTLCEKYINRCQEEEGVRWVTEDEIQAAVENQCRLLGIDPALIHQPEEAVWNDPV